jgi:hypothetical protein
MPGMRIDGPSRFVLKRQVQLLGTGQGNRASQQSSVVFNHNRSIVAVFQVHGDSVKVVALANRM